MVIGPLPSAPLNDRSAGGNHCAAAVGAGSAEDQSAASGFGQSARSGDASQERESFGGRGGVDRERFARGNGDSPGHPDGYILICDLERGIVAHGDTVGRGTQISLGSYIEFSRA